MALTPHYQRTLDYRNRLADDLYTAAKAARLSAAILVAEVGLRDLGAAKCEARELRRQLDLVELALLHIGYVDNANARKAANREN